MATLQLENVPEELLEQLKVAARAGGRDLAVEVIQRLETTFNPVDPDAHMSHEERVELARRVRAEGGDWLTPEFIRSAREYGRE